MELIYCFNLEFQSKNLHWLALLPLFQNSMKRKPKVYPINIVIYFIAFLVLRVFLWIYKIRKIMPRDVSELKPPYLVLGNHVGFWDPLLIGFFLPEKVRFVASDAVFRTPFLRFFLKGLGTIPKKKNIKDTKVIRDIITVIQQGDNVGIFPEAVRNWTGTSFPLDPSIVKLIRLLKVPVVVAKLKGMNLFNPRWSVKLRRTPVLVDYKLLFTNSQVLELREKEIFEGLSEALHNDEVDYQRQARAPIQSQVKAEHISHALYVCPECKSIDSFRCAGNDFHCENCNYDIHIDRYGFFERKSKGELYFDNIRDWYYWEEKYLSEMVVEMLETQSNELIFKDTASKVFSSSTDFALDYKGIADVSLFIDSILIKFYNLPEKILNFNDLQTINPQVREHLEIYYDGEAYRIMGGRPGVSALKWEVAMNALWKGLGQEIKLSPYINHKKY